MQNFSFLVYTQIDLDKFSQFFQKKIQNFSEESSVNFTRYEITISKSM
jgi:hypothetical protein